jgi:hypothetical protein
VSSASGTNDDDWRNWVAVHGNDELAVEDVREIRHSIGVDFRGVGRICSMHYPGRDCGRCRPDSLEVAWWRGGEGFLMKIISWNTRGLGALEKRKEVRKLAGI